MSRLKPFFLTLILLLPGCARSPDKEAGLARTPEQAASQMDGAFANADPTMKQLATTAADAMRKEEYENAVVSLETVRVSPEMTPEQRMAIYSSAVTLEARLIGAMQSGDKNAERAYQLLKQLKKN